MAQSGVEQQRQVGKRRHCVLTHEAPDNGRKVHVRRAARFWFPFRSVRQKMLEIRWHPQKKYIMDGKEKLLIFFGGADELPANEHRARTTGVDAPEILRRGHPVRDRGLLSCSAGQVPYGRSMVHREDLDWISVGYTESKVW